MIDGLKFYRLMIIEQWIVYGELLITFACELMIVWGKNPKISEKETDKLDTSGRSTRRETHGTGTAKPPP